MNLNNYPHITSSKEKYKDTLSRFQKDIEEEFNLKRFNSDTIDKLHFIAMRKSTPSFSRAYYEYRDLVELLETTL